MMAGSKTSLKRPAKDCAFRSVPEAEDAGPKKKCFWPPSACSKLSRKFSHLCLRLLQPEAHVHLAVHRRRGGKVLASLVLLARATVELAEAEVAVGDERAHAWFAA